MSRKTDHSKIEYSLDKTATTAFLWNHGQFITSSAILGLTTYIIAKYLAPYNYGIYSTVVAFGSMVATFVSFGFEGALNIQLPRLSDNLPKVRYLFQKMLLRRVIIIAVSFLLIWILKKYLNNQWLPEGIRHIDDYLYLAILCGAISLVSGLITHVMITLFRVRYFAGIRISCLALSFLIYLYLLRSGSGIKEILWITIVTSFLAMFLYLLGCKDLLIGPSQKYSLVKVHKLGFVVWTNNLVSNFLGKEVDILLMSLYGVSAIHIGFYQIAYILTSYVRMIVNKGMTGILLSAFSSAYKNGGIESLKKWWLITMKFQIIVVSPGVLLLVLFARSLLSTVLPSYADATAMLQTTGLFVLIATVLGGGTHITAFYAIRKEKVVLLSRTIAGVLNLVLDLILIYYFGALGAIIATGVSGVIVGIFELGLTSHLLRFKYPMHFLLKCILCLLLAALIASQFAVEGLLGLIVCSCLYFAVYIFAAWIIKPFEESDIAYFKRANQYLGNFLIFFSKNAKAVG